MNDEYLEARMTKFESESLPSGEDQGEYILLSELMTMYFKPDSWIVDKLIPSEGITAISGAPASFKTWIILMLAVEVSRGGLLFGQFPTNQCGVLIVDEENGIKLLRKRLDLLEPENTLPIHFRSFSSFKLGNQSIESMLEYIKENQIGLVIFDSLIRIHSGDENDAGQMSKIFLFLKQFNKNKVTVVVTHHHRKQRQNGHGNPSNEMRGSSDILASLDCHIAVERDGKEVTIQQPKLRQDEEMKPFKLKLIKDEKGLLFFQHEGEAVEMERKSDQRKRAVMELLKEKNEKLFQKQILESLQSSGLEIGETTLRIVLKELEGDGVIEKAKGSGNTTYYSLKIAN